MFRLSSKLHKSPIHFCRFGRRLSASLAPSGACRFEPRPFAASQPAYISFYPASQLTASQLRLSFVNLPFTSLRGQHTSPAIQRHQLRHLNSGYRLLSSQGFVPASATPCRRATPPLKWYRLFTGHGSAAPQPAASLPPSLPPSPPSTPPTPPSQPPTPR